MATVTQAPPRGSKLTVSFGLVNVGVKYAPLVKSERTKGRMLCPDHLEPIKSASICEICESAVAPITGYEHGGSFVVIEDRKALESTRDGTLQLVAFVDEAELDPLYVEKTHLVWPDDGQEAGYDLLCDVLRAAEKVVMGTTVLNKSTKAVALRWSEKLGALVAHVCTYDAAVQWHDANLVAGAKKARPESSPQMLKAALAVFDGLDSELPVAEVVDEYDARLREAIEATAAGRKVERVEEPKVAPVGDLMAALQASVAAAPAKPRKKATTRKKVTA